MIESDISHIVEWVNSDMRRCVTLDNDHYGASVKFEWWILGQGKWIETEARYEPANVYKHFRIERETMSEALQAADNWTNKKATIGIFPNAPRLSANESIKARYEKHLKEATGHA